MLHRAQQMLTEVLATIARDREPVPSNDLLLADDSKELTDALSSIGVSSSSSSSDVDSRGQHGSGGSG